MRLNFILKRQIIFGQIENKCFLKFANVIAKNLLLFLKNFYNLSKNLLLHV